MRKFGSSVERKHPLQYVDYLSNSYSFVYRNQVNYRRNQRLSGSRNEAIRVFENEPFAMCLE